jgi:hypothetical protein
LIALTNFLHAFSAAWKSLAIYSLVAIREA